MFLGIHGQPWYASINKHNLCQHKLINVLGSRGMALRALNHHWVIARMFLQYALVRYIYVLTSTNVYSVVRYLASSIPCLT